MFIKDLEVSKELSRKELAAVRGGFNFGIQGGQTVYQAGLLNLASPVTAANAPSSLCQDRSSAAVVAS